MALTDVRFIPFLFLFPLFLFLFFFFYKSSRQDGKRRHLYDYYSVRFVMVYRVADSTLLQRR